MAKIRWGVMGVAGIAVRKVIPAMQMADHAEVTAIASRDLSRAQTAARDLGIAKAYGSYDEMLADPDIDAIYNPLPNHLHVPWSIRAAEAGKHVLCEKPIGLNVADARKLIEARDRTGVKIGEAFMIVTHPQWLRVMEQVRKGAIGDLRAMQTVFSYTNKNPANIRNMADIGGGGLMDIGCYGIKGSRMIFNTEPKRVIGLIDRDPEFHTDRLTSAMLDFENGQSVFTCSTQLVPYQIVQVFGTKGRIEMEIPFNAIPGEAMRIRTDDGSKLGGASAHEVAAPPCDQYTLQADEFSLAIRGERNDVPVTLEDAARNMAVIDAILRSANSGKWETPERID
jgi:predicted dehydrogenase